MGFIVYHEYYMLEPYGLVYWIGTWVQEVPAKLGANEGAANVTLALPSDCCRICDHVGVTLRRTLLMKSLKVTARALDLLITVSESP